MELSRDQQILKVARAHFVQHGFDGTRMQEIADEVGINKAMLHYYFRSKEKLYNEIVDQILNLMAPTLANAISVEGGFWVKTESLVNREIDLLLEHPEIPFFITSEISRNKEGLVEGLKKRKHLNPAIQGYVLSILEAINQGEIKALAPHHIMLNVMSLTVFPFMAKPIFCTVYGFPEDQFEEMMKERKTVIVDFIKNGLKPE